RAGSRSSGRSSRSVASAAGGLDQLLDPRGVAVRVAGVFFLRRGARVGRASVAELQLEDARDGRAGRAGAAGVGGTARGLGGQRRGQVAGRRDADGLGRRGVGAPVGLGVEVRGGRGRGRRGGGAPVVDLVGLRPGGEQARALVGDREQELIVV